MNSTAASTATEPLAHALIRGRQDLAHLAPPADLQARVMAAVAARHALAPLPRFAATEAPEFAQAHGFWARLKARVQRGRPAHPPRHSHKAWAVSAASMGVALCCVWLLAPVGSSPSISSAAPLAQFVALPGSPWAGRSDTTITSDEPLWMVPMEVPRAQLVRYGLPLDAVDPAQRVRAQLLVNAQGQALALRIDPTLS